MPISAPRLGVCTRVCLSKPLILMMRHLFHRPEARPSDVQHKADRQKAFHRPPSTIHRHGGHPLSLNTSFAVAHMSDVPVVLVAL